MSKGNYLPLLRSRRGVAWVGACFIAVGLAAFGGDAQQERSGKSATTPGLSAEQLARLPQVLFAHDLKDVPGRNIVVVNLDFPPVPMKTAQPTQSCQAHRHAGSVYVYVTKGSVRLGVGGQPAQTVNAGQSFYEPAGALHTVAESASATEPASAIAVLILPHGAPILTPEKCG